METHWEFEWNMLGTNGKIEKILVGNEILMQFHNTPK
jgi:hypothetical protein